MAGKCLPKRLRHAVPMSADGVAVSAQLLADGSAAGHVTLDGVEISADHVLARGSKVEAILTVAMQHGELAAAAYLVGLAEQAFDITLDYLKTRQQFERLF